MEVTADIVKHQSLTAMENWHPSGMVDAACFVLNVRKKQLLCAAYDL